MTRRETALRYMEIFFQGVSLGELRPLLKEDFQFRGPFHQSDSPKEFVDHLEKDPPRDFSYEIISVLENESEVCIVFEFTKGAIKTPMAQLFSFKGEKISRILLLFDSKPFPSENS